MCTFTRQATSGCDVPDWRIQMALKRSYSDWRGISKLQIMIEIWLFFRVADVKTSRNNAYRIFTTRMLSYPGVHHLLHDCSMKDWSCFSAEVLRLCYNFYIFVSDLNTRKVVSQLSMLSIFTLVFVVDEASTPKGKFQLFTLVKGVNPIPVYLRREIDWILLNVEEIHTRSPSFTYM